MDNTARAIVHDGKIELVDEVELPEGARVLVTILSDEEAEFWTAASQPSLDSVWDNTDDDVYEQLLKA